MNYNSISAQVRSLIGDRSDEPNDYARAILAGLQLKPTYQGAVPVAVVAERRRRNRQARKSRRINRLAARR